ncbi:MAG TPA: hypothetical protein VJS44_18325 [Pyrinomonadaceae bacterium]|nr:hypothetical protein [Pyrinomonadaceae bacterium]
MLLAASLSLQMWVACDYAGEVVLELKDVQNFKLTEERTPSSTTLCISGLAFHSSMAVKGINTARAGSDLEVRILLTPTRAGLTGNFNYKVTVDDDVKRVLFGRERALIWRRTSETPRVK